MLLKPNCVIIEHDHLRTQSSFPNKGDRSKEIYTANSPYFNSCISTTYFSSDIQAVPSIKHFSYEDNGKSINDVRKGRFWITWRKVSVRPMAS